MRAGGVRRWFSAAPYLGNERANDMQQLLKTKQKIEDFFHPS